ncbi:MAG: DNA methyltransferase [Ancylobacter novellus]|uniref:DNA methyltransferase n=1 Tax=Ancylobacter novellus TaxID=921 RepID=A0A2W5KJF1_ANCNO|nr:MAG: DNA methyltransferase [Ancylobacter novellus]
MRDGQKRDFARKLRQEPTEAECAMWRLLRDRRLLGLKFRRQTPLGPYVVDFACVSARLVVELDGGQHAGSMSDETRDARLRNLGWKVLRVWNADLFSNREGVLTAVADAAGISLGDGA